MNQVTGESTWDKPAGMVAGDGTAAAGGAYDAYGPSADAQYQYDEHGGYWDENGEYQYPEGGDYQPLPTRRAPASRKRDAGVAARTRIDSKLNTGVTLASGVRKRNAPRSICSGLKV